MALPDCLRPSGTGGLARWRGHSNRSIPAWPPDRRQAVPCRMKPLPAIVPCSTITPVAAEQYDLIAPIHVTRQALQAQTPR
jgi:hypothetical protein